MTILEAGLIGIAMGLVGGYCAHQFRLARPAMDLKLNVQNADTLLHNQTRSIAALLALVTVCAVAVLAQLGIEQIAQPVAAPARGEIGVATTGMTGAPAANVTADDVSPEIAQVEAYLSRRGQTGERAQTPMPVKPAAALPDVETMISALESRLAVESGDIEGWKTLGWSYLHTSRPQKAVEAYERALAIAPARRDIADGLAEAKVALNTEVAARTSAPSLGTSAATVPPRPASSDRIE